MRRLIRIAPLVCGVGAALCLALAVLLFSVSPAQAACFSYCPDGDCYAKGIPPTCKDSLGVQQTCNTAYPGCGDCRCMQTPGTTYCQCH